MNFVVNDHNLIEIVLVTLVVAMALIPIAKKVANHIGAIDIPNERKVHKDPMPRVGGLAIFGAFLSGYIFYGDVTNQMISILIGAFIMFFLGVLDDIKPIKASYKFLVQILAAVIVVIYGQVYFKEITFLGLRLEFNLFFSYFLSIFFIVAISNAINLIDGLDGLAGGISSIYFLTITLIALLLGKNNGLDIVLAVIMLGSTLGFLANNFPPAKIFMGDSGSLFLGFMISVIALVSYKVATMTSLIIPVVILAIPIFDTVLAILRRLLKKESIGAPDKDHFHHQLLKLNLSTRKSILIIYFINMLFSAVSISYVLGHTVEAIALYGVLMLAFIFMIFKTDILYKHKEKSADKK